MTTSPNLGAAHLEASTTEKEPILNASLDLTDEAMNGYIAINFASDADYTLSLITSPQEWQYGYIDITDTGVVLTTTRNIIVPNNKKKGVYKNSTAQSVVIKTSAGTGVTLVAGAVQNLQCDGTNVISADGGGAGLNNLDEDTTPQLGGNLDVNGNSIVSASNGDIPITPNGTGSIILDGLNWPQADGTTGQVIQTNGAGQLSFVTGGATDANAVHVNAAGEISALTTVTVASGDYILIEDVSDSNNKKKILASDLLGGGTDAAAIHDDTANEINAITEKTTFDPDDYYLLEDSEASGVKKSQKGSTILGLEENAQTGTTYTLVLDDAFKEVSMTNAASNTLTVPPNSSVAFPIGTAIAVTQGGAGQTTIAQGAGVTIKKPSTLLLRAQESPVMLIKRATDTWRLYGDTE